MTTADKISSPINLVLVTGATGFIGAHVVDALLSRGLHVRCATRSASKAAALLAARPDYASQLEAVQIEDFSVVTGGAGLEDAAKGVDAVVHVASVRDLPTPPYLLELMFSPDEREKPFTYDTISNEQELILPAINGVRSILSACSSPGSVVQRVVLTSSFASILDVNRKAPPYFTYTASDWNPLSYAESIDPSTSAVVAYRGSKKFAELEAWNTVKNQKPQFDLVTLCPPMTFGPVVHPMTKVEDLNESNKMLWKVACGERPLPIARVPFWVDARDLAEAHAEALLKPEAAGKRFVITSPERFSYGLAAEIILDGFPWAGGKVAKGEQGVDQSYGLDGETAALELGFRYRPFSETVLDLVLQAAEMAKVA